MQRSERGLWRGVARAQTQIEVGAGGIQDQREQFALGAGARREIERHHGAIAEVLLHAEACHLDARGVVGEAARREFLLVGAEQQRQVGARFAALAKSTERHRIEA